MEEYNNLQVKFLGRWKRWGNDNDYGNLVFCVPFSNAKIGFNSAKSWLTGLTLNKNIPGKPSGGGDYSCRYNCVH